jgi:mannose-6-phosphate isomerase-like protein (cupin superfamily)
MILTNAAAPAVARQVCPSDRRLTMNVDDRSPQDRVFQTFGDFWTAQAVHAAARLGLADHLAERPRSAAELGAVTRTHAPPSNAAEPAAGARYVFLRTGEQTGGAHEVIEAFVPPGGEGPPGAVQRRQEKLFLVVEGQVEFSVGGDQIEVVAGGTAYAPRGVPHRFINVGPTPARVIIAARPASCLCCREQRPPNGTS